MNDTSNTFCVANCMLKKVICQCMNDKLIPTQTFTNVPNAWTDLSITRLQTHICIYDVSDNIPGSLKNIEEPSTSSPEEPNINFLCKYCPQTFTSKIHVKRHLEIYHQIRTKCKYIICDRFYVTEGMLLSHERKSHADKSFYRCITCSNRCLTDLEYQRHKCNPS